MKTGESRIFAGRFKTGVNLNAQENIIATLNLLCDLWENLEGEGITIHTAPQGHVKLINEGTASASGVYVADVEWDATKPGLKVTYTDGTSKCIEFGVYDD